MKNARYLTAKEATKLLGVSTATLYAYVSRGLIRSETGTADSRARRYRAEDVEQLNKRKTYRQNPTKAAQDALHWGTPLLESALTLITEEGLYYRGYDALKLATRHTVEEVAALLWTGQLENAQRLFATYPPVERYIQRVTQLDASLSHIQRLHIALTLAANENLTAYDLHPQRVAQTGARILRLMVAVLAGKSSETMSIVDLLQSSWCPAEPHAAELLNAALIVCADHELNVSAFTARVAASAETQPYWIVIAGMAALQGTRHGGNLERVDALLRIIDEPQQARQVIVERLRLGERIPGFGHHLYPEGDPRARFLLHRIREYYPQSASIVLADTIIEVVQEIIAQAPNIDFALAILARTLQLPSEASLAIFALGRTIGWIGHAIEQYASGALIRPRASYVGEPPRREE